jgi:hypothetical protein
MSGYNQNDVVSSFDRLIAAYKEKGYRISDTVKEKERIVTITDTNTYASVQVTGKVDIASLGAKEAEFNPGVYNVSGTFQYSFGHTGEPEAKLLCKTIMQEFESSYIQDQKSFIQ